MLYIGCFYHLKPLSAFWSGLPRLSCSHCSLEALEHVANIPRAPTPCCIPSTQTFIHGSTPLVANACLIRLGSSPSDPIKRHHHRHFGNSFITMADEAANEPPAELGQLPLRPSSTMASVDQPTIATSFPQFALLPEEIRRVIWEQACIPIRMQCLRFPSKCGLPRAGQLDDPADAPNFNYPGIRDDLAAIITTSKQLRRNWAVPGCDKFRNFYWFRDLNKIGGVCPESRDAYLKLGKSRVKLREGIHVSESFDIFHFSSSGSHRNSATCLLTMWPRLSRKCNPFYDRCPISTRPCKNYPVWLINALRSIESRH